MAFNPKPIHLITVFGIPVRAHYSWLPVFPFYAWAIASAYLPAGAPGLQTHQYWLLGFATTFLLFASVLIHELAHALMARGEGLGTGSITLYMFGGLATLEGQPASPSTEFKIAIAGPAASFMIGTLFFGANELLFRGTTYLGAGQVLRHLGLVNWFLAGFNILPGLPLDGGRVLRAILWRRNKNFRAATATAVKAGFMISIALVVTGIYFFLFREWITGMWSVIVGVIVGVLLGSSEGGAYGLRRTRRGTVEDVMNQHVVLVPPEMKLSDFIEQVLKSNHHTSFPVARERRLHGMLLLEELKTVPPEEWPTVEAREVMRPVDNSMFISHRTPLENARRMLSDNGIGRAVVIDSAGLIVGYVSERDFARQAG